ncbi:16S rRNA (uracil(1498)-N(3))-methyltransferase [Cesiribacter sp. SM1]|uniref:16S rRNA (uracil(1498)-N(3))-methyltransferase n=1 Tax=Cesiribacter sp. SM1 TaxID=2861196 RepID=UPI001CD297DF|nr:16S rRNA (uracil(1498)-N(3))-methyltransferase [Cesiribacter sp. SM1]
MQVFYQPETPGHLYLTEEESKHCVRVLRHRAGDSIWVTNGKNQLFECRLTDADPAHCTFTILAEKEQPARTYRVHLAIAPTKNTDRLEWMLEKCVELGVDEVSLLVCKHSERFKINPDRLYKKAVSAMKQSLNFQMPMIHEPVHYKDFIAGPAVENTTNFIAYVDDEPRAHLMQAAAKNSNNCILIGPEGDFSKEEIEMALENGFQPVSLGPSRLRTETAGLAACHILNLLNQV